MMANFSRNMWTILSDEVLWRFRPYKLWLWQHIARETENLNTEFKYRHFIYNSITFLCTYKSTLNGPLFFLLRVELVFSIGGWAIGCPLVVREGGHTYHFFVTVTGTALSGFCTLLVRSKRFIYSPQRPDRLWGPPTLLTKGYLELISRR
jgi:hypothetical protein